MINGSVRDLDHLFCMYTSRGVEGIDVLNPLSDHVHMDLCEDYTPEEKVYLGAYLRSL